MPVVPKAYPGGFCQDVECIDAGVHRGDPYTLDDLHAMVRNFYLGVGVHDPPVVIGHNEEQPLVEGLAERTGDPAVGWITAMRVGRRRGADGRIRPVLLADMDHVHPTVAALVNSRAYKKVSPEIYDEASYPEDAPVGWRGKALRRLALLGGELPQIRTLRDLPPVRFAEGSRHAPAPHRLVLLRRGQRLRTADGRCWAVFSEVAPMDRLMLEKQLQDLGWSDAMIEALKPLDDDQAAVLATAALAQGDSNGGGAGLSPEGPVGAAGADALAEMPDGMDHQALVDWLVEQGQDPRALADKSDAELTALYHDLQQSAALANQAGDTVPLAEPPTMPSATASGAVPARYAELARGIGALERKLTAGARQLARLDADARRRRAAERAATVKSYCERWLRDGFVTPAEVDARSRTPNLYHRLVNADVSRVRKYGETALSDFDAAVAEIEGRGSGWARRHTGERIPDPERDDGKPAVLTAERRRSLLSHTERGRAILRSEDAEARRRGK